MAKIPVFVSCPTKLNDTQKKYNEMIDRLLLHYGLERRALGVGRFYAVDFPLKEVYELAKQCAGGIILGFEQLYLESGIKKRGTIEQADVQSMVLPTPWNDLEAGILYALGLPLLIIKEKGISGGIFDEGTSDRFIHCFDSFKSENQLDAVFVRWNDKVIEKYMDRRIAQI